MIDVKEQFNRQFYNRDLWHQVTWMGVPLLKFPTDMVIYAELIHRTQPDLIIECGTFAGGSAYFMATICEMIGHGHVATIDPYDDPNRPDHRRITYVKGSSTDPKVFAPYQDLIEKGFHQRVMVVLDSDHSCAHVMREMDIYGPLVTPGCYMIVEDTNLNGHPVVPSHGPGPYEAVEAWLPKHPEFQRDPVCERFMLTANPGGYLKKIK